MSKSQGNDPRPRVSVIVPAYNAAPTLERCVKSLLAQTYANLEIIVVANACIDATAKIAREISTSDSRVVVIVTGVAGVSHARNLGLKRATGEYVGFADADDWVEPDMFEALVNAAVELRADMVCGGTIVDSTKGSMLVPVTEHATEISADDFYYGVLMGPHGGSVCNKLFSRRAVAGRYFDESMAIIEDSAFCCALARDNLRLVAIPGCNYHYVSNETSATNDMSCLITRDGKWAYLEGALVIKERAATEAQMRISEKVNCTFAASGVRELAGKADYADLHKELCGYLRSNLGNFFRVEHDGMKRAKTIIALFAPRLWAQLRRSTKLNYRYRDRRA